MPVAVPVMPRKILPPPMTTASCTPAATTDLISSAMRSMVARSTPYGAEPIRASPESFSSTRRYAGVWVKRRSSDLVIVLLNCRHYFCREVGHLFFDALAHLETHEARDVGVVALQQLVDGHVGIFYERLAEQSNLAEVFIDAPFDHLVDDVGRFARGFGLFGKDFFFLRDRRRRHLLLRDAFGATGGDVHREVLAQTFVAATEFNQHADLAAVHIAADVATVGLITDETAHADVLAEFHHHAFARLRHGRAVVLDRQFVKRVHVSRIVRRHHLGHDRGKSDEVIALGDEVGLGIHFHDRRELTIAAHEHADGAVGGGAAGLLLNLGAGLLAQQVLGGGHVAL